MGGVVPRLVLALVVVAATGLAGCVGYTPVTQASCGSGTPWSDQLVLKGQGLYASLDASPSNLTWSGNASWDDGADDRTDTRLARVSVGARDGTVRARAAVDPAVNGSLAVDHPRLAGTGGAWLDTLTWYPQGDEAPQLAYLAPENGGGDHVLHLRFLPDAGSSETREAMGTAFAEALFPDADREAWEAALEARRPVTVDAAVDADGLLDPVLSGNATVGHASLGYDGAVPGARGQVVVEGAGPGNLSGRLVATLVHEVKAVSVPEADPPVTLEVTPADAATVTAFGDAALGAEGTAGLAEEHLEPAPGVPDLPTAEARHRAADEPTRCG